MKKNWNVAKIFTLLITVLFLASTLFVGCKEQEPEPGPTVPTKYMVTYVTNPEGLQVENFPTKGEVEENKTIELRTLTLVGYTFDGWYDGDTKVESPYKVTKAVTLTAKFTEIVPDTTNNFNGNYYAGEDDMGYIEFTTETDCVVFVVSEVYATYTVADNVATIKGVKISDEEDYSAIEIKTTTLANDSFSVTYPVEICQIFDPSASEDMVITYTKVDNPSSEGGEGVVVPDPVETFLVTYAVEGIDANLVTGLPETGSVNKDTVLNLSSLAAPEGYVFDGWFINDELVSQHTVVAAVTIVAKFSEIVPVGTTYTIPDINAEWTNIVVYAWSEYVDAVILQATNDAGIVTFQSTVEYEKAIVVKINDSVDTNNVVIDDVSEFHVWSATVKVDQTGNLELGENNTYKEEEVVLSETKIYLAPNSNWKSNGARFAAYFFGNGDTWVDMTDSDGDGIYECSVPEGFPSVIFCRMNPEIIENNWNEGTKWNQSGDLTVPTDGTNLFTVPEGVWDVSTGSWSTKE